MGGTDDPPVPFGDPPDGMEEDAALSEIAD